MGSYQLVSEPSPPFEVPTLGVVAYGVVAWTRKRGVPTATNVAVTNKSRSGGLWSGGLDRKEVPTMTNIAVTNEDVGSSKRGVLL